MGTGYNPTTCLIVESHNLTFQFPRPHHFAYYSLLHDPSQATCLDQACLGLFFVHISPISPNEPSGGGGTFIADALEQPSHSFLTVHLF